jgi:hypothetical protein
VIQLTRNSASVATIARIPYVHRLQDLDWLYANNELLIWSIVEVGISIIATSIATLRPLKLRLFPHHSKSSKNPYYATKPLSQSVFKQSSLHESFIVNSTSGGKVSTQGTSREPQRSVEEDTIEEGIDLQKMVVPNDGIRKTCEYSVVCSK